MDQRVLGVAGRIKNLEIQGATNVAESALKTLGYVALRSDAKNKKEFIKDLEEVKTVLFATRPTEPMMRNGINYVISGLKEEDVMELKNQVHSKIAKFMEYSYEASKKIAEIGAEKIQDGQTILTHCHSETVMKILKKAKENGKKFNVICTETRPLFQGRKSAKELVDAGIPTSMVIDFGVGGILKDVSWILTGADVITAEGWVINKIGTNMVAMLAKEYKVPFYVAASTIKFDPATKFGKMEEIERRPESEVWEDGKPGDLKIINSAFSSIDSDYIDGIITEKGIIPPGGIANLAQKVEFVPS